MANNFDPKEMEKLLSSPDILIRLGEESIRPMMPPPVAKEILGSKIKEDNTIVLSDYEGYISWTPLRTTVSLDGTFSLLELEAIVSWAREHQQK